MTSLLQRIVSIENGQTGVSSIVVVDNLQSTFDTKQDVLTAGDNISIVDNVISASGSGGSGDVSQADLDTKQDVLTARNISIVDNVISSSGGGDVSQADLDTKQDVLRAGTNISIVHNVISASGGSTDTTALQSQVDTNTSDISTLQSSRQNTLTARDNITISSNTISTSDGSDATPVSSKIFYAVSNASVLLTSATNVYIRPFNIIPTTNNSLYTFSNNDTITILQSGNNKIEYAINWQNFSFRDRTVPRSTIMINKIEDITYGGQAACYLRANTFGRHGTNSDSRIFTLTANDTIQIQNKLNKSQEEGYTSHFLGIQYEIGSNILVTYLD